MKKLIAFCFMLFAVTAMAQAPDTLTPEKKARWKIGRIRDNTVRAITPQDFRNAFNALADLSVKRAPYVSLNELREGKADTASIVQLSDLGKTGLLRYDPNDTTSPADSVMVFVTTNGRRYIRQYETDINASWLTQATESSFVKVINYVSSKPVTILINRIIPITTNRTIPANVSLRFENGGGFNISTGVLLTINSPLQEGNKKIFYGSGNVKLITDRVNAAWFGMEAFNTTTLTGPDNYDALRKANYTASLGGTNGVTFPAGHYASTKLVLENVSFTGNGRTTFWALPSSEPAFVKLKEGVVQNVTIGGFNLRGNASNIGQIGLDVTAIYSATENTGGLWYSTIKDMQISGFDGHAMNFEAIDPLIGGVYKDIANQFLTFDNVRAFRSKATSRALRAYGQFGQVIFNNCEFDGGGSEASVVNSINVEMVSSSSSGDSDEIYSVDFNTCTFQQGDKGIRTYYAKSVSFNGCHWENMARPMYFEAGSEVKVGVAYFGNCGLGSLATGGTIEGALVYVGSTCLFEADQLNAVGGHDFTAIGASPTGFAVKRTNFVPNYKDLDAQTSVAVDGTLAIYNYSSRIYLNSNPTRELATIQSYKGIGELIVLHPLGTQILNNTGNISFPNGESKLIFQTGQLIVLRKVTTKWVVVNSVDSYHYRGNNDPEGVVSAMRGTIFYRLGTSVIYQKTTDEVNTGWVSVGSIQSIRTGSGNGSSTTITIPHSLTYTPVIRSYAANNAESAKVKYITADATNFILNFDVAPAAGTNNLSYNINYTR